MKTWTKALIAAGVVAVHALAVAATAHPGGAPLPAGKVIAQAAETEWLLPEVVVTAGTQRMQGRHAHGHDAHCNHPAQPAGRRSHG